MGEPAEKGNTCIPNGAARQQPNRSGSGFRSFDTVEELRQALLEFRDTYNATWYNAIWLIERHEFRPPNAVRQDQLSTAALAA